MTFWGWTWVVVITGVGALLYTHQRKRSASIRKLAQRFGFAYLGAAVPKSLVFTGTRFRYASSITNLIDGERTGIRTIAFDCAFGTGKGRWSRTVIAVQGWTPPYDPGLEVERSGDWVFFFKPKEYRFALSGLMPIDELEAWLTAVGKGQSS